MLMNLQKATRANEFSNDTLFKINIKSIVFLYSSNNWKSKFKNTIYNNIKIMKCLRINITKFVQDVFTKKIKI